jgi:hypothetical protein
MKFKYLFIISLLVLTIQVSAQNARFSQLWSAPTQFNPSLTGRFDGKVRGSVLNSWQTATLFVQETPAIRSKHDLTMNHFNASVDIKLGKYRSSGDDATEDPAKSKGKEGKDKVQNGQKYSGYWGVGLNYYSYGHSTSPITGNFITLSVARHFYNKNNRIWGVGVQVAQANGSLDENRGKYYDKEISGGGFRYPYKYSSDDTLKKVGKGSYTDVNIGGYYGRVTEAVMFEIGGAMHHLFYPYNDLYNKNDKDHPAVRHRITAHSLLRLKFNSKWGIVQRNMFWQEGLYYRSRNVDDSLQITSLWAGLEFYKLNPKKYLNASFGLYTRTFKTLMPFVDLNLGRKINLRYSYELPINSRNFPAYNANRNELGLIVTAGRNTKPANRFYQKLNFW